ncbi:antibiotic biosynthesis monooxygenase [Streptomyces broussonetiae]|uniref:Antibiotic biosynthesis monooxygenase n=1 Tax=Streptomyces broussonetiae TaxID=2686304 RepID=A0A6I6MVF3_9ACTN|nr:antibiotic biosynthesis monooxygenase [Streptomyces broussonetiae]QHA03014.1 antibiotic biosynthesis monooxygenase [Streptomyces broussonetiae]
MNTQKNVAAAATAIIGQNVLPGMDREFEAWQEDLNAAAASYPGFLGAEISPPTPLQPDWVIVYRFDSVAHLQAWINSATRQTYLDVGAKYFDGPATQQVVSSGTQSLDPLVTVVVTHLVPPSQVDDFLAWQHRLVQEESKFEGFRGSELFRPIEGLQEEWTTLYRYDTAEHLDAWLTSPRRQEVLAEGEKFSDFKLHTIDNSFGSWFAFGGEGKEAPPPPSETRTSLAVWVGLYPTVVLLTLALSPLHLRLWIGLLVGNLLSSFIMTFLTMPHYVNPLLGRWLRPPPDAPARATLRGIGVVAVTMAFWAAVFYLVTVRLWTLP